MGFMIAARNPFRPTLGVQPPVLIGRDDVLHDVRDGILEGFGSPLRALKLLGPRGIGKTVLLESAADVAREMGWLAVSVTASANLLDDTLDGALEAAKHLLEPARRRLISVSAGGAGFELSQPEPSRTPGWRVQMQRLLDIVESNGTGILFTVDEVSTVHPQLIDFGKNFQHLRRERREVALVAAGLPLNISDFESLPDTSFIRRAIPHSLAEVSTSGVRNALRRTFLENGKNIEASALRVAADATQGYPFLVQLVGYQIWRAASGLNITLDDVQAGVAAARRRIGDTVHTSAMADLSALDKTFLIKMAIDDGPSRMADITSRAGWSPAQSNVYRSRLITQGMIRNAGHGLVEFAFPYLGDFLREHAATLVWSADDTGAV
jgi:hypothetical protein